MDKDLVERVKLEIAAGVKVAIAPIGFHSAVSANEMAASQGSRERDADHRRGDRVLHIGDNEDIGIDRSTADALRAIGVPEEDMPR